MALHKNLTGNELHNIHSFTYADASARNAASGFTTADIGKVALQSDTKSFWILTNITPTWAEVTGTTPNSIFNRVVVGKGGSVNFTNISDAINYTLSQGADSSNEWIIEIFPGIYIENNPLTVPPGIVLMGQGSLSGNVIILPTNPSDDLFINSGGVMTGLTLGGVTDPQKALVLASTNGVLSSVQSCVFTHSSIGFKIENGAVGSPLNCFWVVSAASSAIDKGIVVDGTDSRLIMVGSGFIAFPPVKALYPGSEPIKTAITVKNNATADIFNSVFFASSNKINATSILVDGYQSQVKILGCSFEDGYVGVEISSSGDNASVIVEASTIFNYTKNFVVNSSNCAIFEQGTTDAIKSDIVSGGTITGVTGLIDSKATILSGNIHYIYPSLRSADLSEFIFSKSSTGLNSGGVVSSVGGLDVSVSAGTGWVRRSSDLDIAGVDWDTSIITLQANATNYVILNGDTFLLSNSTSIPNTSDILLSTIFTDSSDIRFMHNTSNLVNNFEFNIHNYLLATKKFALNSGLAVSQGSSLTKINIDSGSYYLSDTLISFAGDTDAIFSYFYNNGTIEDALQANLDIINYDDGGTLTSMTDGYYRVDTVYLTSDGRISLIYGTDQFENNTAAAGAPIGLAPSFIEPSGFSLSNIIIKKNVGIDSFIDLRIPTIGVGGSSAGITDHGLLSGLLDDDHFQYLLANGSRAMSGNLNMGSNNITNVDLVDGVDVSNHSNRHNPGDVDALAVGIPVVILAGAAVDAGSAASFSRSDHQHGINSATPLTISNTNSQGVASTISRSDHVHAHGSLAGGSTHALVISDPGGSAGYMSASDKQKLNGIESGATNTTLTDTAPVNVNKSAASAGTSTEVSRQDHKHDISTGTPVAIGITNSAGSATTLALSDHVHRGNVLQTVFLEITTDTTTVSTTLVDLLSQVVTTTGGNLLIHFTVSGSATTNNRLISFVILIDGVIKRGTAMNPQNSDNNHSCSIIYKATGISSGAHTVKIQWKTSGGIAVILPVTNTNSDHASLLITETAL